MTFYAGEMAQICQVLETTLGTAITSEADPDAIWLPAEFPVDITPSPGLAMIQGLGGDHRASGKAVTGMTTVQYPLTMAMTPDDTLGYWLLGVLGADDPTPDKQADNAWAHAFTLNSPGVALPGFTHLVDKQWKQAYYRGAQIGALSMDIKPGDGIYSRVTGQFNAWDETAHSGMGSASYGTVRPFSWRDFAADIWDASAYTLVPGIEVEGCTLTIDRSVTPFRGAGNSGLIRQCITGPTRITGTLDVAVSDAFKVEFQDKFRAATIGTIWIRLQGDVIDSSSKYTLEIKLPSCVLTAVPESITSGLLRATVSFEHVGRVTAGTIAGEPTITLTNGRSATYNK